MLFLAVMGFILINVLGIVLLPRFTVCVYIWYTIMQWGYLTNRDPGWMMLLVVILFLGTIAVFVWDILRLLNFFDNGDKNIL